MNPIGDSVNEEKEFDLELPTLAHKYTIKILEKHGNEVSDAHSEELHIIADAAAGMIAGVERDTEGPIRKASALPCGAGKTTTVRGLIKATHELNRPYRIVVCAEKVDALCELFRDLTGEDGVPREKVSLFHTYALDPNFDLESPRNKTASEAADDWDGEHAQFVLLTHQKLRHGHEKLEYDILIYDETLLLGVADTLERGHLAGELNYFATRVKEKERRATDDQKALAQWCTQAANQLLSGADADDLLVFDALPIDITAAKGADQAIHGDDKTLRKLFNMVHESAEIRLIIDCNQGAALVTYQETIPDSLSKILILDASHRIRTVTSYDPRVEVIGTGTNIKDHSDVNIHICKASAGKRHIMRSLTAKKQLQLFDEVADLTVRKLQQGKKVLIFTFKDNNSARPVSRLKELVTNELGKSPDMLSNGSSLNFLTWGSETATNNRSDCDTVIFAGLYTLPSAAVAGRIFAQSRDIRTPLTGSELASVVASERIHSLYQGVSRGSCRTMRDGNAKAMDAYVFTPEPRSIKKSLGQVMGGVQFREYKPKYLKTGYSKKDQAKERLQSHLENTGLDEISIVMLFRMAANDIGKDTRQEALKEVLQDELALEWVREGRSLKRAA